MTDDKNKDLPEIKIEEKVMPFQCMVCESFGAVRKPNEIYWTCLHCGTVGGLLIEPIKFRYLVDNKNIK